jgi:hypothetical protein
VGHHPGRTLRERLENPQRATEASRELTVGIAVC